MPDDEIGTSEKEPDKSNVIDIRDRLPPLIFGDNATGRVAAKLFTVLINDPSSPAEHIAALMLTSIALQQNVLKAGWKLSEDELDAIRAEAMVIADGMRVTVKLKKED